MDFDATDHKFCVRQILEKKWEYNEAVHQLFLKFKKAYDSVRREVWYNILIEFGTRMKMVRNEIYSRVRVGIHLSEMFPIRNGLKQGDAVLPLFFNFTFDYAIRRVQINQDGLKLNGNISFWFMLMMTGAYIL